MKKLLLTLVALLPLTAGSVSPLEYAGIFMSKTAVTPNTRWLTTFTAGGQRNDGNLVVGCSFTVGGSPITVKSLYRWVISGNTQTHRVGIFQFDGTLLGFVSINTAGKSGWVEGVLSSPVVLSASTTYVIASEEFINPGDFWLDGVPVTATTGVATIGSSVYSVAAWGTFAWNVSSAGQCYVPVSFGY